MKNRRLNEKQLLAISKSLGQIYKDGIPLSEGLELVRDNIHNKDYKDSLEKIIELTKEGRSLSESFKEYDNLYPSFFTGLISIGENTGKLYEVLRGISIFYEKYLNIKSELKNACIYPIFVLSSIFILGLFLTKRINPNFYEIYKSMNITPPNSCLFLYNLNSQFEENFFVSFITIACWGLVAVFIIKIIYSSTKIENFKNIKIVRDIMEYMVVLLFSIITSTGINISYALKYCENNISSEYINEKLKDINKSIIKGRTLSESLEKSNILSKYTLSIIRIREESGTIEAGFNELSQNLEESLSKQIKLYLSFISPIFVIVMAVFIVLFLMIFVLPLFDSLQKGIR